MKIIYTVLFLLLSFSMIEIQAQEKKIDISSLTKEKILALSNEDLLSLSIEDLDKLATIVGVSVDELLDLSTKSGQKGGFGKQLEDLNIVPYLHGYFAFWYRDFDYNRGEDKSTFNLHYFNPIIGMHVKDKIVLEAMPEYEHGGSNIALRYAILDYSFLKNMTLRVGKFLMPIGKFNEYYYPEHINIFADRPLSHWSIIPSVWSEVGIQLRGNIEMKNETSFNYSLFVVNGLQQPGGGYGGDIRLMRDNFRDYKNENKAIGGRIGLKPINVFEVGFSYYNGVYSEDGKMKIGIGCVDAEYATKRFILRGEYVFAKEDTLNGNIKKDGGFVESSYRINKYLQPAIRLESVNLPNVTGFADINGDGSKDFNTKAFNRISLGLIIYPEPEILSRFNFKINYSIIPNDGQGQRRSEFVLQTAIGF